MKLTEHFTLAELTKSQTAARRGIDNAPKEEHMENLQALATYILEPLRKEIGKPIFVNSGYRCEELNRAIGGSKTSQHMKGEAADIECFSIGNYEMAKLIARNFTFDQLILECWRPEDNRLDSGWVHVSFLKDTTRNRDQVLSFDGKKYKGHGFDNVPV